jgi:hypothetical protein
VPCISGGPAAGVALSVTDVGRPACAHGRMKLITQVINCFGNSSSFVLPHVICTGKAKILMHLAIMRISDISVIRDIKVIKCLDDITDIKVIMRIRSI